MRTITSSKALFENGLIQKEDISQIDLVASKFSIAISPKMQAQINENSFLDPIYAQFVPNLLENDDEFGMSDPIGDDKHEKTKGLVHRYSSRALIKLTNTCSVYCRFCFRREKIGRKTTAALNQNELENIVNYLSENTQINEVILSGGDPLIYNSKKLGDFCEEISKIKHIKLLRIHSRVPIVSPELIKPKIINALLKCKKSIFLVVHINHINEISPDCLKSLAEFKKAQINILSQSVLLKGINDNSKALALLFNKLLEIGIKPYYLHHPDLAKGTSHFQLNLEEGMQIYNQLKCEISGIGLPRYVLDIPGGYGKIDINGDNILKLDDGNYIVIDKNNHKHFYKNITLKLQTHE